MSTTPANHPAVSVVMPVYNAAPYLQEALDSIRQQTYQDFEVVAVNDGSTDGSREILVAQDWSQLRIIDQKNAGQSAAINRGVGESCGQFIKIVDADDWINPTHLEAQISAVRETEGCVAACRWGDFRDNPRAVQARCEQVDRDYADPLEWLVDSLTHDEGMMGGWRWLIPRDVWDRAGGYDVRLGLNNDFHASIAILLSAAGVRLASDAVYGYRNGISGVLSSSKSRKAFESALLTTELGCELLLQRENSERIRRICADRFQRWAFDFFPEYRDLTERAEEQAAALGGSTQPFPGGRLGQRLAGLIGWKNVRRLQSFASRYGWNAVRACKRRLRERRLG